MVIDSSSCGSVDLSEAKCTAIVAWPKAIHEGHGQCVFVVEPTATDKQIEALGQIFTGKQGACPGSFSDHRNVSIVRIAWKGNARPVDVRQSTRAESLIRGSLDNADSQIR